VLRDSLMKDCSSRVMALAKHQADSIVAASGSKPKKVEKKEKSKSISKELSKEKIEKSKSTPYVNPAVIKAMQDKKKPK